MKNGIVIAFAVLLLSALVYPALSVGAYTVTPTTLRPGEEGSISFTITNSPPTSSTTAASELSDVQVFFAPSAGMEFKTNSPFVVGTIGSGSTAQVSVPIRVLPTAKGGVITVTFYISEKDKGDRKTVNAVITVINPPLLTLSTDKQTVFSSDNLLLTITNNGGTADRATLTIPDGSGFALIGTNQIYIGTIADRTEVNVQLDASGANAGISQIPFVLTYQQEGGVSTNETKYLSVSVKKESENLVFTQVGKVIASQDNTVQIKVTNNGKALSNFRLFWTDSELKAKENNQFRLGDLPNNGELTAIFLVRADAAPGVRDASLKMVWNEGGVDKEETLTVPIVITSDADVAIYVDAKPAPIVAGGEHTLSVLVSNIGSYKILNVEVEIADSSAFDVLNAQKSQYIGGLEADDFSTVQYKVRFNNVESGSYPLPINVKYKDQSGIWVQKDQTVQINVRSQEDVAPANDNSLLLMAGVAVLVVGGYWYFRMRKPRGVSSAGGRAR